MLKKIFILFKIARKLALSDAIKVISKIHKPPVVVQILVNIFSISLTKKDYELKNLSDEEKLCKSIEGMGTTFIKLGQFLATRPDIIGEKLSKQLEKLQDRVPPFSNDEAKNILKDELGEEVYNSILNFSEPIAAASIAQVHKAQFNDNGTIKDIAIKILRPDIKKKFNEEIDALMLLAYLIENIATKTKRLKLMEVVFLLKEITNHEMDLRFEAAAANEFYENTKMAFDPEWKKFTSRLIKQTDPTIVPIYFYGCNSIKFQLASHLGDMFRASLLFHEVKRRIGSDFKFIVGEPFKYSNIDTDLSNQELADYLRTKTYLLNPEIIKAPPYGLDI